MEELMYYVWQQRMFQSIVMLDDTPIEIIHPGMRNLDAGPDFFNAKIRIDGVMWAGNVEMHVKASDWYRHNHQADRAYDNVILHVVLQADAAISVPNGERITTVVMKIPPQVMEQYNQLISNNTNPFSAIRCSDDLPKLPVVVLHDWMTALTTQRMLGKMKRVRDLIDERKSSWQEALYVMLARSLGTGINSDAMETLARSVPYAFLLKHMDNPLQIRALLLGQSNLMPLNEPQLKQEYDFLRAKFNLTPMPYQMWKLGRIRPQANPINRITALANLLCRNRDLLGTILHAPDVQTLQRLFYIPSLLGTNTGNSIIINAVVPIILAYAQWNADEEQMEKAFSLLDKIPAEANRYTECWVRAGLPIRNAMDSQALLHLYREYCEPHKCMNCRIGCWILKNRHESSNKSSGDDA